MKIGPFGDQRQHNTQQLGDLLSQQQRGQQRLQGGVRISAVETFTGWKFVADAGPPE